MIDINALIGAAPEIIKVAAKKPLGVPALAVLLLSLVALIFFRDEGEFFKGLALVVLAVSFICLSLAVIQAYVSRPIKDDEGSSAATTNEAQEVITAQAAAVCFRRRGKNFEFLLVRSGQGDRRIFPKGKIRKGEAPWIAAEREAMEEAGVKGEIRRESLTQYWHVQGQEGRQEWATTAYLLEVTQKTQGHERKRNPKWYTSKKAEQAIAKNRDPKDAKELQRVIREATAAVDAAR